MTKRDYIRVLEKKGLLKIGLEFGVISTSILSHAEIFDYWIFNLKTKNVTQSVLSTSDKFGRSTSSVWEIIMKMRETYNPLHKVL